MIYMSIPTGHSAAVPFDYFLKIKRLGVNFFLKRFFALISNLKSELEKNFACFFLKQINFLDIILLNKNKKNILVIFWKRKFYFNKLLRPVIFVLKIPLRSYKLFF